MKKDDKQAAGKKHLTVRTLHSEKLGQVSGGKTYACGHDGDKCNALIAIVDASYVGQIVVISR